MENTELKVRDEYEGKMEAKLKEFGVKLDELMAKGETAKGQLSAKFEELIDKQSKLKKKLADAKLASEEAWKELKPGLDHAWDDFGHAFNEVKQASERAAGKLHK
jgi:hypothetical protein